MLAKRKVRTVKHAIARIVTERNREWKKAEEKVFYGCRRRKVRESYSPFGLLYRTLPRMNPSDPVPPLDVLTPLHRQVEFIRAQIILVERVDLQAVREDPKRCSNRFQVQDQVLVVPGKALNPNLE